MKVKFKNPEGNLPASMLKLGYSPRVDLHLKDGEICVVYGISEWRKVLHYLIFSSTIMLPIWLPADLFEVVDPHMHFEWYFRYTETDDTEETSFMLGFQELVVDVSFDSRLIERDPDALRKFLDQKKEMDEAS